MANEATVRASLQVRKGNLYYQSNPSSFRADVSGAKGPTPGAFTASTDGTDVDLSELDTPGLCRVMNLDDTHACLLGRWDPDTSRFYPVVKLLPGESYVLRLAEDVLDEYAGTGTGTTATASTLRVKAVSRPVVALVEAFEA